MGKGKNPRKRREAVSNEPAEKEIERQTQEKAELVPPREPRHPAPAPRPSPQREPVVSERPRSALLGLVSAIRLAVDALLDLADAAADAITKQIEGRA
jgi:hypothetical protein